MISKCTTALAGAVLTLAASAAYSQTYTPPDAQTKELALSIFRQLIEINSTDTPIGSVSAASKAMQQRFLDAGFSADDMYYGGPNDHKENLLVRFRGTGEKKPVFFIGHLDVVDAKREDWTTDPFKFVEKDGYYYGRGTQDMKENDTSLVTTFIRLKKEGYKPNRDLILALTADEEGGASNGVEWLLKNHRDLIGDPEFVINADGGGIDLEKRKAVSVDVDATEKLYGDYQLLATNPGGHSSLPVPDNAIYHIADALQKLQNYKFPFELNGVTRAYFTKMSTLESGEKAADMKLMLKSTPDEAAIARLSENPIWNSMMHTTCVATRLLAGHANNALPQMAQANVNCRILPGHSREEVRQDLIRVIGDSKVTMRYVDDGGGIHSGAPDSKGFKPAPPNPQVMEPLEKLAAQMWPGAPVIPTMATGASDSVFTNAVGLPSYGVSGMAIETNDVRAHGKDERLPVESFYRGVQFYYLYVKALSGRQ